jgi:uncharacterized GH25 family protein
MKKIFLLSITALVLVSITSCRKFAMSDNNDISNTEEVVNVTLNANEVYKYTLSEVSDLNNVEVSTPSAKSAIAIVETDGTTNNFVYTPDASFSGTDVVVISHDPSNTSKKQCGAQDSRKNNQAENNKCSGRVENNKPDCKSSNKCGSTKPSCEKPSQASKHKIIFNITVLSPIN